MTLTAATEPGTGAKEHEPATAAADVSSELKELAQIAQRYYAHDGTGRRHALNVAKLALMIGRGLRLPRAELVAITLGAVLHDIGKLTVPAPVLEKPGHLTSAEWTLVRAHPATGERLVSPYLRHPLVRSVVRWHHERVDGRGYPDGLRGETIPLAARIVSVADAYEAMVAARPYSRPRTPLEAVAETVDCAGRQFDVRCVERLSEIVAPRSLVAA
ncbi:MAG: HD domain-containing protein [Actinomycetota bacterium]|nr:HD domain-containing protein [Actinomycetota bacterium]